ncbi:MAG TPA: prepilin-type N-terminal cleavage/methylation domain-containing protein [Longimicrobiales bacterium]
MVIGRPFGARPGLGLTEVLVAVVVLGVGVLGAVATTTLAVRTLGAAAARETAIRLAGTVLDSLLQEEAPVAGEQVHPGHRLRWTVRPAGRATRIVLEVEYRDGTRRRRLSFEALRAAALRPIGEEP